MLALVVGGFHRIVEEVPYHQQVFFFRNVGDARGQHPAVRNKHVEPAVGIYQVSQGGMVLELGDGQVFDAQIIGLGEGTHLHGSVHLLELENAAPGICDQVSLVVGLVVAGIAGKKPGGIGEAQGVQRLSQAGRLLLQKDILLHIVHVDSVLAGNKRVFRVLQLQALGHTLHQKIHRGRCLVDVLGTDADDDFVLLNLFQAYLPAFDAVRKGPLGGQEGGVKHGLGLVSVHISLGVDETEVAPLSAVQGRKVVDGATVKGKGRGITLEGHQIHHGGDYPKRDKRQGAPKKNLSDSFHISLGRPP